MDMKLQLFESSWENLFEVIRDNNIKSKGNFWAAIQSLEQQYDDIIKREKQIISERG